MKSNKIIDLHTHSFCSDGSLSPEELICHGKDKGLSAMAITDHDTISGLEAGKSEAEKIGMIFLPGIEISCDYEKELHIVGLNIDYKNKILIKNIDDLQEGRTLRNKMTMKILCDNNIIVEESDIRKITPIKNYGRAHIAQVMVNKGYVSSVKEAFSKYLGKGKLAYQSAKRPSAKEAIRMIKESGGYAVLAHCHSVELDNCDFIPFIKTLKNYGLDGLEGYYTTYTKNEHEFYCKVARDSGLKISGGSDFHGKLKPKIELGNLKVPYELLKNFN